MDPSSSRLVNSPAGDLPVLTVGALGVLVKDGLDELFPEDLWVEGQVSNYREARSGHAYFDLVEPSEIPGKAVSAKLSVALFKNSRAVVDRTLVEAGGLSLADDLQLRIRARLDFYPPNGRLQLIMNGVDPTFTLGRLAAERERILHQLAKEGLLTANRANPIPVPPLRIGLVTSVGSAAHADFIQELVRSGWPFTVLEHDTRVQGDGAAADLSEALYVLATHRPDVIALVRGGGSATDLAAFDAEVLARTIATLDVPVVTGIGHEVDRAVADEVAHTALKTPTACATAIVEQVRAFADAVAGLQVAIAERVTGVVDRASLLVDDLARRTAAAANTVLDRRADRLVDLGGRLRREPPGILDRQAERLDGMAGRLRALDPARIVARGWSITRRADGSLVRSVADVSAGDPLVTRVAGGTVTSTVDATSADDPGETR
ncbi:MAG: exodeoxyribonuclease VII large subunit [Actinomycetota bacterium]|nr:exodeoxyribonuclease VII large subunit [Actinomycetota bacterium]MEC8919581.1 exodeoxyribonuclease VII large subunit [Actinomycetota bacterium]MEC8971041.1 exodeoxyribonuclease VII large subunit [Actinomycetota bacterium]MEC9450380.1 exodeoxyribonuclease VII large subunit [Actinomycetota bacterium]MED5439562.1 exodeoxyribonuclease VII large subunit [Actinomycetota bacterium]